MYDAKALKEIKRNSITENIFFKIEANFNEISRYARNDNCLFVERYLKNLLVGKV